MLKFYYLLSTWQVINMLIITSDYMPIVSLEIPILFYFYYEKFQMYQKLKELYRIYPNTHTQII